MGKPTKWLRFLGVKKGLKSQKPSKDAHSQKDEETSLASSRSPVGSNQDAYSKEETAEFSALPPPTAHQQQSIVLPDGVITTGNAAAIKLQTAFRSFLVTRGVMVDDFVQARQALRALKGLVRLQALVRGHAVRKQGAISLRIVLAVVKVQAVARGRRTRLSSEGQTVQERVSQNRQSLKDSPDPLEPAHGHNILCRPVVTKPTKAEAGTFSQKLAAYATQQKPAPSVSKPDWTWLELWTAAAPWEPGPAKQEVKAAPTSLQNGDSGNETGGTKAPRSKPDRLHSSKVPSYMAATESAKAKLRSLSTSPRTAVKESPEKVASPGEKRRFSLPGTNGKFQDPATHPRRLSFPVKAR